MENRGEIRTQITPEKFGIYAPICNLIIDNMGQKHLDFGCGLGLVSSLLSQSTEKQITGYDINPSSIEMAEKAIRKNNLTFTSSKEKIYQQTFDSISATFVYHETQPKIFKDLSGLLKQGGRLIIFDYNLKNCGLNYFKSVFKSQSELKEVQSLNGDWEKAYLLHTAVGLKDCQNEAEKNGFKTIKVEALNSNPNLFVWVGQK